MNIRYRVWCHTNSTMYLPEFLAMQECCVSQDGALFSFNNAKDWFVNGNEVDLMPWTGIKDKNYKEIYNGDIIRHHSDYLTKENVRFDYRFYRVVMDLISGVRLFHPDNFKLRDFYCKPIQRMYNLEKPIRAGYYLADNFEVVGNIYQHAHLLNSHSN